MKSPITDALAEELYKKDSPSAVRAAKMMMLAQRFENELTELQLELKLLKNKHDATLKDRNNGIRKAAELVKELKGWKEAAYSLGEAIPASWDELQPPAEQLRKFKEMVALQHEKDKKI